MVSPRVETKFGEDEEVTDLNLNKEYVEVKNGNKYKFDYLVIALGSEPNIEKLEGLNKDINTFYTSIEDALDLKRELIDFNAGKIVVMTPEITVSCPGAPCKFNILLNDYFRNIREDVDIDDVDFTFLWPTENVGPSALSQNFKKECKSRNIRFFKNFEFDKVDENNKIVKSDKKEFEYDLLITSPPFKPPKVVEGITNESGWIPVDKNTLQYNGIEKHENIFAVGDIVDLPIPKTGIGAYYQALSVSESLINKIKGNEVISEYYGEVGCPIITQRYSSDSDGEGYIPIWTYKNPPKPFETTSLGYRIYRMYYHIYWDAEIKALI